MKFHQLPLGARFAFRGATYTKVSPLKARSEADDAERLIARSAEIKRLTDDAVRSADALPGALPEMLSGADVETATWQFVDRCKQAATRLDPPLRQEQLAQLGAAIDIAAQQLLSQLARE